jgi:hypothetical protein
MFIMTMPVTFKVGDTARVLINGKETTLQWADGAHLVIEGADERSILHCSRGLGGAGVDCWTFFCSDRLQADQPTDLC